MTMPVRLMAGQACSDPVSGPVAGDSGRLCGVVGPTSAGGSDSVAARRRRMAASAGSVRNAAKMSTPATWSMPISHCGTLGAAGALVRSEEHTSELQSRRDLVCRLLLEKKKKTKKRASTKEIVSTVQTLTN